MKRKKNAYWPKVGFVLFFFYFYGLLSIQQFCITLPSNLQWVKKFSELLFFVNVYCNSSGIYWRPKHLAEASTRLKHTTDWCKYQAEAPVRCTSTTHQHKAPVWSTSTKHHAEAIYKTQGLGWSIQSKHLIFCFDCKSYIAMVRSEKIGRRFGRKYLWKSYFPLHF